MKPLQYGRWPRKRGRRKRQTDPMLLARDRCKYDVQTYNKKTGKTISARSDLLGLLSRPEAEREASDIFLAHDKKVGVRIVPETIQ